jgi:hypothetical protein
MVPPIEDLTAKDSFYIIYKNQQEIFVSEQWVHIYGLSPGLYWDRAQTTWREYLNFTLF